MGVSGRGLGGWARVGICPDGEVEEPLVASPSAQSALVQRLLFYPDGGVDGHTPPVLAAQDVLAELGGVHAASTGRGHAETLLEQTLKHLEGRGGHTHKGLMGPINYKDPPPLHQSLGAASIKAVQRVSLALQSH